MTNYDTSTDALLKFCRDMQKYHFEHKTRKYPCENTRRFYLFNAIEQELLGHRISKTKKKEMTNQEIAVKIFDTASPGNEHKTENVEITKFHHREYVEIKHQIKNTFLVISYGEDENRFNAEFYWEQKPNISQSQHVYNITKVIALFKEMK